MKTVKVVIEIPAGPYCIGCPCGSMTAFGGLILHGCQLLHKECRPGGVFLGLALKDKDCPAIKAEEAKEG